ncbi:putative pentatricopeptide repeat-containing protein At5g13230, mitochondrial [Rosa rugosa]|uniref:putative pentatricopeptide repeat-containing protein At5g13230, mitochondrial n=1 Tax=Rosa rugosa TaxID=74645 RepID=UPI002B418407|nr:putative pentatricopeptide repeat-containing protein At5g13230, mitochondrial [Rosa rugosa]XP_061994067.1 putative pentatricopeptide repeat-containing protein At5g13230, mitochondrial [Rosa rugosa]XP_061994068.1 putative pentatricopeptide repeat-containing protein At5g13230, mitochondrial [Rosa rugosa]XP_061994069.1 putative pentatricopeptide repeat-containing protein At5g13230, mitochondrial [Rosa rugosa]XP_061994071.1 putative pentatricopeptide repeat-containing protein At5g13230, mitochon
MLRLISQKTFQCANFATHCKPNSCSSFQRCGYTAQLTQHLTFHPELPNPEFDSYAYATTLQHHIQNGDFTSGTALHCDIVKKGGCLDLFAYNILANVYVKAGLVNDAVKVFDEMPRRNVISFVTLIQGFSESQRFVEAVELFGRLHREGQELNPFVFTTVLKLLVRMGLAELVWTVHACIYKLGHGTNAFVGTALIDAYSVCGDVDITRDVFDGIVCKDMVAWSGMVGCYAENGGFEEAVELFCQMRVIGFRPNNYTFSGVLKACLRLKALDHGKCVHGCVIKSCFEKDLYVGISLLDLYTTCGDVDDARRVFQEMPKNEVIPWTLMVSRYAQSDCCEEALDMFCRMRQAFVAPNQFTYASVLQACATMESLVLGKQIHCQVVKVGLDSDIYVLNALMDFYAKCGQIENSMDLFVESSNRNDVSWNTMIVGYVRLGDGEKALTLFSDMLRCQVQVTDVTYSSALRASASIAALEPGLQIHSVTIKTIYDEDTVVGNSLIDMYAKCGSIKDARLVFDKLKQRDEVSWNAMISGYSLHGLGKEALKLFEMMQETNCKPNKLTFVGVLSACSHAGLLDQGNAYFNSMVEDYYIEPCMEHYTCMVWLLGKSGQLGKAVKLIGKIPFEPSAMVWRALLGACVIHNDVELGRICAQHVLEMDPQDEATHVLLSNLYATAKRWDNVAFVRKNMKRKGVKKEPGLSWIENQGTVHYFTVGDTSHPDLRLINGMLEWLKMRTLKAGHVPNCNVVMLDVEDDEKERLLWVHSERLALALALVRTPSGSPIRIIKNLRICVDCHATMKLISKVVQREIIVRDMNRFHHFKGGICSCDDYW